MDKTNRVSTSEEELASDLLSIVHIYSCRQMGKRKYGRKPSHDEVHQNETETDEPTKENNP
jgi:predicted site-specific integrase-resolvase